MYSLKHYYSNILLHFQFYLIDNFLNKIILHFILLIQKFKNDENY